MTDEKNRQPNIEVVDIDSLVADDHNFNRGTDEGKQLTPFGHRITIADCAR